MSQRASILSFDQARSRGAQPDFRASKKTSSSSTHTAPSPSSPHGRTQTYRRNDVSSQSHPLTYRSSTAQSSYDRRHFADQGYASRTSRSPQEEQRVYARRHASQTVHQSAQRRTTSQRSSHQTPQRAADRIRHAVRSKKVDRDFERYTQQTERTRPQEQTSRPALYQMQMGKTQKRSTRMQQEASATRKTHSARKESRRPKWHMRACIVACAILFCGSMLYQPIANLYNETRSLQQLEAEYDALQANNVQVRANLDYLATDEGLEEYAHNELGWIRNDEHTARVADVAQPDQSSQQVKRVVTTIPEGSIETPDTWYSPVLDIVFGYSG